MADMLDESSSVESSTVGVFRTSATVKGGRRFSFGALVVVGDKRGRVGFGYGKSNEVPQAVDKASKYAKRAMVEIPMAGRTLPHQVEYLSDAWLDEATYDKGRTVKDEELAECHINRNDYHGEWNYEIHPRKH